MGYHIRQIERGQLGKVSKIREELEELEDAMEQDNRIMAHVEMSDLYGALRAFAAEMGLCMEDLRIMSDATASAFEDGTRT